MSTSVIADQTEDDCVYLYHCNQSPIFPFVVCNLYNNSNPIILDSEFPDNYLNSSLFATLQSLKNYQISNIEKCVIYKYDLIHL